MATSKHPHTKLEPNTDVIIGEHRLVFGRRGALYPLPKPGDVCYMAPSLVNDEHVFLDGNQVVFRLMTRWHFLIIGINPERDVFVIAPLGPVAYVRRWAEWVKCRAQQAARFLFGLLWSWRQ